MTWRSVRPLFTALQTALLKVWAGIKVVRPELRAGPGNAAFNNASLALLALSVAGSADSKVRVIFPDGDIEYSVPLVFRLGENLSRASNSQREGSWPAFVSEGTTTFIWTGGQVNGGHWRFEHATSAIESTGLSFTRIRWAGPGLSVASAAVAAPVGAQVGTVQVGAGEGARFAVGDAIAIMADPLIGGSLLPTSPPWWATVTAVAGDQVAFVPVTCVQFAASAGNRVQRWKQTRAVEIGGQSADRQDVFMAVNFDRCAWIDYFSGVSTQDVTGITFDSHCRWGFTKFGTELGYNNDSAIYRMPFMQNQRQSQVGTCSVGSRAITGLAGTAQFKVGMTMADLTAPEVAQAFSEFAVIESIDSPSQVTMTHPSTVSGQRTLQPQMGWLVAIGSGTSPWYPREIAPYDGSRANIDQTVIENPLMSMGNGFVRADGASNSNIELKNFYIELGSRLMLVGNQEGTSSLGPYVCHGGQIKAPQACMGSPIEIVGGGANVDVQRVFNDAGMRFPAVQFRNSSSDASIIWRHNNLSTSSPAGLIRPDTYFFNGITPPRRASCVIDIRGNQPSGLVPSATLAGGTFNLETAGTDGLVASLTANTTLAGPANWAPVAGKTWTLTLTATGAHTLTLASAYRKANGAAIGALPAATAGATCVLHFVGDGARWLLVGGTLAGGDPVFVAA